MENYKKLVERLREEPKDSRKAVLSIYDLCVDAAYAIESLLDRLKYAEGERDVVTKCMIEVEEQNAAIRRQIDDLTSAQAVIVKEFDKKLEELDQVKAEADAAVADLEAAGICDFCGHWLHSDTKVICGKKGKCEFVWRGPQKEA